MGRPDGVDTVFGTANNRGQMRVIGRAFIAALTFTVSSVLMSTPAVAGPGIVDQFQLVGTEQNQAICCNAEFPPIARGQSFTVGVPGILSGLELSLFTSVSPSNLVVSILDMAGGDPRTAPVLGSVSVPAGAVGPIASTLSLESITATFIDLAPLGISVQPGELLAFRLTVASPLPSLWALQTSVFTDRYSGGQFFAVASDGTLAFFGDAAFKTFVEPPVLPFAEFRARAEVKFGPGANDDAFDAKGNFTLGAGSNGIAPTTEPVVLQVGTFATTIAAGAFTADGQGRFRFEGVIRGVALELKIVPRGAGVFAFAAEAQGADLTGTANPVHVRLTIGDDSGSATLTAEFSPD